MATAHPYVFTLFAKCIEVHNIVTLKRVRQSISHQQSLPLHSRMVSLLQPRRANMLRSMPLREQVEELIATNHTEKLCLSVIYAKRHLLRKLVKRCCACRRSEIHENGFHLCKASISKSERGVSVRTWRSSACVGFSRTSPRGSPVPSFLSNAGASVGNAQGMERMSSLRSTNLPCSAARATFEFAAEKAKERHK